jgi:NAD(P)-dependent dehydrogenase (short-subunit alcohol dehydrogenase family)
LLQPAVMVKLNLVKASNAELCTKPLVAVFVGGNSNIGAETVKCLARTHGKTGKGLRAYIVGRNAKAAEAVIAECQKLCPTGQFLFQQANNLALMKDVDSVCAELLKAEEKEAKAKGQTPKIDILVMSQANFQPWHPRQGIIQRLVLCIPWANSIL